MLYKKAKVRTGTRVGEKKLLVVPGVIVRDILRQLHDAHGHMGEARTRELVKQHFF